MTTTPSCSWKTRCFTEKRAKCRRRNTVIPLGVADVKREGTDISLIGHGRAILTALKAAEILAAEHEINAEVVDLRSIRPLDEETVLKSVRKTHRAVLVDENKPFCGVSAQISTLLMEKAFDDLDAPGPSRLHRSTPRPFIRRTSRSSNCPTVERIVQKVLEIR